MTDDTPGLRDYACAILRDSFILWSKAEHIAMFAGVVLGSLLLGVFVVTGVAIAFKPETALYASGGLLLWLVFLVFFVSPYRIWKENNKQIQNLKIRKDKQGLLDEISELRMNMSQLRIDMEADIKGERAESWKQDFTELQELISNKIEDFAGHAESRLYNIRGNLTRRVGPGARPHQLYIDLAIHDLDYLRAFLTDYLRGKER